MAAPALAFASDVEVIDVERKTAVVFLLGEACKPNLVQQYTERFTQAWIVCAEYEDWKDARANLYGFEKYWHTLYITQDNQHPNAPDVKGEAFFRDGSNYAYAINNPNVIAHEMQHLIEKVHYTSDGRHDSECDDKMLYKALWRQERAGEKCIGF
jgi:hypothetical protein